MDQRQRQPGGRGTDHAATRQKTGASPRQGPSGRAVQRAAQAVAFGVVSEDAVLALQHGIGNAAFNRALVAVQRAQGDDAGESGAGEATAQRSLVDNVLSSPGRPLDAPLRSEMETRLNADFSDVRVHTDSAAQEMVARLGARAITSGNHVALGAGGGDPHTLAHELTHVIQQRQGPVAGTDNGHGLKISDPSDRFEREAEENARRVLSTPLPDATETASPAPAAEGAGVSPAASVQRAPATHGAAPLPVQRMDDYGYGGGHGGGYGGPGRGYAPPQVAESEPEPEREWSPKEVRDTIAAWGAQPPMKDYGARRQGQAHEEFHMRFPRSWQGEETEQTLSDTSALLFDSVKESRRLTGAVESEHAKEREVQGMLINDRLVFATNLNSSVDSLMRAGQQRDRHGRTTDPTLEQLLRIQQSDRARTAHMSERERRNTRLLHDAAARKNAAIFSEQRGEGEQGRGRDATAMALRAKMGAPVIVVDVETPNLHELLTSREYEGRVFLLRFAALDPKSSKKSKSGQTAEQSMHAEQKLLLALHRAGIRPREDVRGPISIMGKYRPCMGCAAALYYYRHQLGFEGLTFDENYGHLFQGSVDSLYDHHRHIMDENYLAYIEQMIYDDITSTPAMANEAPPQNAEFRRGGYSVRVPGKYAAKRAVVTPSQSDAEFDDEGGYKRVIRPMEETWDFETAPVGIGEGADHTPMPRRKFEGLSDAAAEELRTLWNGSKSSPATNASRQRAVELFDEYNAGGMTFEYLGAVVGRDPGRINSEVARYRETEAHRTHVPSRSSKTVTEARAKTKGVFKKGGELDEHARNIIDDAVQRNADHPWSREWLRLHNEALAREESGLPVKDEGDEVVLSAVDAPADVLKAVAGLQRGGSSYDVGKLARYLHAGGRDKMKSAIRKGNNLLDGKGREAGKKKDKGKTVDKSTSKRTHRQPAVRVKNEDVEMAGASSYPPAPQAPAPYDYEGGYEGGYATTAHDPAGGQGMMPAYQQQPTPTVPELLPSVWTVNPYEQGASGASSSSQAHRRTDTVPGYTTQYDHATGQQFFVDPDTGLRYFRINGQMVPESYEDYEDTRMGGTQDDYYYR